MIIFIWGFMGSGKSTMTKLMSTALEIPFIDLDVEICKNEELTVDAIFKIKGEEYFRKCEQNLIFKLSNRKEDLIVACGGGTPCYNDLDEIMLISGKCIYLNCDDDVLFNRIVKGQSERPLVTKLNPTDLKRFINEKLEIRKANYLKANIHIDNNDIPEVGMNKILGIIKN